MENLLRKNIIFIVMIFSINLSAQQFTVQKVSGNVLRLQGTEEKAIPVKRGDKLSGSDLLITDMNSFIQLNNSGNIFMLKSNSALGLNNIKKISINDLLLQLAVENIKNIPKGNKKNNGRTTAVYGSEIGGNTSVLISEDQLGVKKLNGAKQLSEEGYKKSAIIVARETFRKHPNTKSIGEFRIYFASQLYDLNLFEEALGEFNKIQKLKLTEKQKAEVTKKIKQINMKLISQ